MRSFTPDGTSRDALSGAQAPATLTTHERVTVSVWMALHEQST